MLSYCINYWTKGVGNYPIQVGFETRKRVRGVNAGGTGIKVVAKLIKRFLLSRKTASYDYGV